MRFRVKSRQAFYCFACTRRRRSAPRHPCRFCSCLAVLPAFFPRRRSPLTARGESGGGERILLRSASPRAGRSALGHAPPHTACRGLTLPVGWRDFCPGRRPNNRLSVWNHLRSQAPSTVYAPGLRHAQAREPTPRTNGAFPAHPAAQRRLSPTSPHTRSQPRPQRRRGSVIPPFLIAIGCLGPRTYTAAASLACRRAVESTHSRQSFSSAPSGNSP